MPKHDVEVVIAGASFAGLAVARALRGRDVVLLDPHPVGAFPKSACALPISTVRAFGAETSVLERHDALFLHHGNATLKLPSQPPYATIDYASFCSLLQSQGDARVLQVRAKGYAPGLVETDDGEIRCRYAVDASGPSAVLAASYRPGYAARRGTGAGLETEVPRPSGFPGGLHIYFGGALPPGYGWAFGSGATLRVGIGVFDTTRHAHHLKSALSALLTRLELEPQAMHGGLIPLQTRAPALCELFVVGDAAGQVLPVSAEGIRPALHFGNLVGYLLCEVLAGRLAHSEARRRYLQELQRRRWGYHVLGQVQIMMASQPERMGAVLRALTHFGVSQSIYHRYLRAMGPSSDTK